MLTSDHKLDELEAGIEQAANQAATPGPADSKKTELTDEQFLAIAGGDVGGAEPDFPQQGSSPDLLGP